MVIAPFPLDIHIVEELVLEFAIGDQIAFLDHPVGKGRFAMINMGYDAEVAYMFHFQDWLLRFGREETVRVGKMRESPDM